MILPSYKPNSLYNVNQRSQRTVENILSTNTGCIVDRIFCSSLLSVELFFSDF